MIFERQTSFGWLVAIDMFLGGAGAGAFLASFILNLWNRYEALAKIGAVSGPVLALIGVLFLVVDLGRKRQLFRLFHFELTSWMSRGTWILTIFIIFGLGYSLSAFELFSWLPWGTATGLGEAIGTVAAIFAVLTMIYTGLLLGVVKRIPFWNSAAVPVLFVFSGLCTGVAFLLLVAPFLAVSLGQQLVSALQTLIVAEIVLILTQLFVLGLHVEVVRHGGGSAVESVRLLKGPLFIAGVIVIGLVIPVGLLFYGTGTSDVVALSTLAGITGILLLTGGILLRYSILRGGVYLPLYSV